MGTDHRQRIFNTFLRLPSNDKPYQASPVVQYDAVVYCGALFDLTLEGITPYLPHRQGAQVLDDLQVACLDFHLQRGSFDVIEDVRGITRAADSAYAGQL